MTYHMHMILVRDNQVIVNISWVPLKGLEPLLSCSASRRVIPYTIGA